MVSSYFTANLSILNMCVLESIDRGYRIDYDGILYNPKGKIVKGYVNNRGYKETGFRVVILNKTHECKIVFHKVQAYVKYGVLLFNKGIQVRHLNGNPLDNAWDNIAIGSASDNCRDKTPETRMRASLIGASYLRTLTDKQVKEIFRLRERGHTYTSIMKIIGIKSKSTVSDVLNKKLYVPR